MQRPTIDEPRGAMTEIKTPPITPISFVENFARSLYLSLNPSSSPHPPFFSPIQTLLPVLNLKLSSDFILCIHLCFNVLNFNKEVRVKSFILLQDRQFSSLMRKMLRLLMFCHIKGLSRGGLA
ncbi:hypothetical protein QVD17_38962 [Tagetes erecta]|uniref:Uncharacterized protein n=1 Tax=Tagetes erecta TaxID=13708 RepID=A0AAD8JP60_TARER|nr:hypothetical protein QVD17_38962 [Tagetes erecta]